MVCREGGSEKAFFLQAVALKQESPQTYTISGWADLRWLDL